MCSVEIINDTLCVYSTVREGELVQKRKKNGKHGVKNGKVAGNDAKCLEYVTQQMCVTHLNHGYYV